MPVGGEHDLDIYLLTQHGIKPWEVGQLTWSFIEELLARQQALYRYQDEQKQRVGSA